MELGISKNEVIKAFLRCKKDEDLAFNYLIKNREEIGMKEMPDNVEEEKKERK